MSSSLDALMDRSLPPLTGEQEVALFQRLEAGDSKAEDLIVRHNLRLCLPLAARYNGKVAGHDMDDLLGIALKALVDAIRGFDWRKGYKFSTYATWAVRRQLSRALWMHRCEDGITYPTSRQPGKRPVTPALKDFKVLRLDAPMGEEPANMSGILGAEDPLPDVEMDTLLRDMSARLSPRERAYLAHRMEGGTRQQWREQYGDNWHRQRTLEERVEWAMHRAMAGALT